MCFGIFFRTPAVSSVSFFLVLLCPPKQANKHVLRWSCSVSFLYSVECQTLFQSIFGRSKSFHHHSSVGGGGGGRMVGGGWWVGCTFQLSLLEIVSFIPRIVHVRFTFSVLLKCLGLFCALKLFYPRNFDKIVYLSVITPETRTPMKVSTCR